VYQPCCSYSLTRLQQVPVKSIVLTPFNSSVIVVGPIVLPGAAVIVALALIFPAFVFVTFDVDGGGLTFQGLLVSDDSGVSTLTGRIKCIVS
jgi:hypothetical protein